jgi:hypothetical protein
VVGSEREVSAKQYRRSATDPYDHGGDRAVNERNLVAGAQVCPDAIGEVARTAHTVCVSPILQHFSCDGGCLMAYR